MILYLCFFNTYGRFFFKSGGFSFYLRSFLYLWRVDDEVPEGEAEAIVLPLDPDLEGRKVFREKKLSAEKLSVTLSVLEAKLNADCTGNPTYIRIMSVLDLKGGLVR